METIMKYVTKEFANVSLNRTMQYGNRIRWETLCMRIESLNRTMQYGNPIGEKTCLFEKPYV